MEYRLMGDIRTYLRTEPSCGSFSGLDRWRSRLLPCRPSLIFGTRPGSGPFCSASFCVVLLNSENAFSTSLAHVAGASATSSIDFAVLSSSVSSTFARLAPAEPFPD